MLALGLALALAAVSVPASGAPATSTQIDAKKQQAASAQTQLAKIRGGLSTSLSKYSKLNADLTHTRAEIADNSKRLGTLERSLARESAALRTRADYLYRSAGGDGALSVLFGATTFEEFVTRLDLLTQMAESDAKLIGAVKRERAEYQRLRSSLKEREAQQVQLVASADAERARAQSQVSEQQRLVDSLSGDVQQLLQQMEREQQAAQRASSGGGGGGSGGGGGPLTGSVEVVNATVQGRPGTYWVMKGEPRTYVGTGVYVDGQVSTYSNADNGSGTSSGRPFNDRELTCAHKTLPFGTRLAVSHAGHHVIVIVTDRGPYNSRVLDLSTRAGELLGLDGVGDVHAEVVQPAS